MAKHIGDLSYTEDDILIYSIYVYPPLKQSYENKLVEYFTEFGDVENINMMTEKRRNRTLTSAVLRFKNPESASKALRLKTHRFLNRVICVKNDCSFKQPYQTKLTSGDTDNPNIEYTILKLNDDCLLLIFQYLSLQDQYNLSTLCGRLENIYESSIKMKKSIRIAERDILNINCLRIFLEKVGPKIQCITFCSSVDYSKKNLNLSLDHLSKLCPNLYKLKFDGVFLSFHDIFQKICTKFVSLRHIELKNCGLNDSMIERLTNLLNIKYLDLTYNEEITGLYLHKFYNLETLILNCCYDIKSTNFIRICSTINNLKELNINQCYNFDTDAIDAIVDNLNHLEILTISMMNRVNYDNIAKLKSLKHLTINEGRENSTSLLIQLAKEKSNQLETLKMGNFTYDDLNGDAIKKLNKLKQLDLPDAFITNQFFNDLSRLRDLKILNAPNSKDINYEIVLEYLNKIPATLEEIDLYHLDCDEKFVLRASEILKFQHRPKPLILTLKATSIKKKFFVEDDVEILKIKTTVTNYDFLESFTDDFDSDCDSFDRYNDSDNSSVCDYYEDFNINYYNRNHYYDYDNYYDRMIDFYLDRNDFYDDSDNDY